jgi:hypothetical protein
MVTSRFATTIPMEGECTLRPKAVPHNMARTLRKKKNTQGNQLSSHIQGVGFGEGAH